ncbi:hypothetical protein BGAPBR_0139 [Borreliella garinii PBr]|uniref:Uncharacterized protein n=1 Tax=Borreliella garinii PBr TaxID=498743 RepID=B7XTM5_BORGR|nr:hypothetical protein BGAPBR_0139 [Borreliella garinii PBr]
MSKNFANLAENFDPFKNYIFTLKSYNIIFIIQKFTTPKSRCNYNLKG